METQGEHLGNRDWMTEAKDVHLDRKDWITKAKDEHLGRKRWIMVGQDGHLGRKDPMADAKIKIQAGKHGSWRERMNIPGQEGLDHGGKRQTSMQEGRDHRGNG
jgi:hypothetical protein